MNATWVGALELQGLSIPLRVAKCATEKAGPLQFICPEHDSTVSQLYRCAEDGELILPGDLDKGIVIETLNGLKVTRFTAEELGSIPQETNHAAKILSTRYRRNFNPAYFKDSYQLETLRHTEGVFAALARALDRKQMIALGTICMRSIVHPVAFVPTGKTLTMFTLHRTSEISVSKPVSAPARKATVDAFVTILSALREDAHNPVDAIDPYQQGLKKLINDRMEEDLESALGAVSR